MTAKQWLASLAERQLGVRIVKPSRVGLLFEEQHLSRFLSHFDVDCVFDVGANIGQYATALRDRIGYRGHIISFEPNPLAAEKLRANSAGDPLWHVEELALDAVEGQASFNVMESDQFSSLRTPDHSSIDIFSGTNKVQRTISITTSTIARVLPTFRQKLGFKRPFLKMDTQGHDLAVAKGAGDMIAEFVGLQSELSIRPIYEGAPDYREPLEYYRERGFVLSAFVPNNEGQFPDLVEIDCIMYNKAFPDRRGS
jgi:FkbM family methyltransferase